MKRFFALLLSLVALASLSSCKSEGGDKLSVVCNAFPAYDIVRRIGGDTVEYSMILSPGKDGHSYEPSVSDVLSVKNCSLFVYGGGGGDLWADKLLASAANDDLKVIAMMDEVPLLCASHDGHEHSEDEHTHSHEYDEHVWTSPENVKLIARAVANALAELDPENAQSYLSECEEYEGELDELSADIQKAVDGGKRRTIVVADRFPLIYFVEEYGLDYVAAFPGCNEKTEPSPKVTAEMISLVENENIPAVFKMELSDGYVARAISEKTGAQILTFYSCHSISKEDLDANETYLTLMRRNIEALKIALG